VGTSYSSSHDDYLLENSMVTESTSGGQVKLAFSGNINDHIVLKPAVCQGDIAMIACFIGQ